MIVRLNYWSLAVFSLQSDLIRKKKHFFDFIKNKMKCNNIQLKQACILSSTSTNSYFRYNQK